MLVVRYTTLLCLISVLKLCGSKESTNNLVKRFIMLKRIRTIEFVLIKRQEKVHSLSTRGKIWLFLRYTTLLGSVFVFKLCGLKKSLNNLGKGFIKPKRNKTIKFMPVKRGVGQ